MKMKPLLYDFHTHVESIEELKGYLEDNIIPVINIRHEEEYFQILKYYNEIYKNNTDNKVLFFSTGIHPFDVDKWDENSVMFYEKGLKYSKFLGEIGMDNCWSKKDLDDQEKTFINSLEVAKKYNIPVVLHTKGMEKRILEIISKYDLEYIVHWYSCEDFIDDFIDLGCYFTIGPAVTVDENVINLAKKVPYDKMLIETDGLGALKWLFNKEIENYELREYLELVIDEIAMLRDVPKEFIYESVNKNSEFLLKDKS